MYAVFAGMSMTLPRVIQMRVSKRGSPLQTFPMNGFALSAAQQRINSRRNK